MSAAGYQSQYSDERQECLKGIKILLATKEKGININSKINSADLLLVAAQFLLCNGI